MKWPPCSGSPRGRGRMVLAAVGVRDRKMVNTPKNGSLNCAISRKPLCLFIFFLTSFVRDDIIAIENLLECYRFSGLTNFVWRISVRLNGVWNLFSRLVYFLDEVERLRIKKVINNNLLCVIDDRGNEMIVTGKGLGFKRKTGEHIDPALVEKTYRMEKRSEQRRLRELVEQIPIEHLKLTEDLIEIYQIPDFGTAE